MQAILDRVLCAQSDFNKVSRSRPFILLTWAQSADAMLATSVGAQTVISGLQSSTMTHALRAVHDAILVGSGTILADDPRLSCRLDPSAEQIVSLALAKHGMVKDINDVDPRPVVLDTRLRSSPNARFIANRERLSIVVTNPSEDRKTDFLAQANSQNISLEFASFDDLKTGKRIPLQTVQNTLYMRHNITSVMVEGGPSVLSSFFNEDLCDLVIVTIAPKLFGDGVHINSRLSTPAFSPKNLLEPQWFHMGDDIVLIGMPAPS